MKYKNVVIVGDFICDYAQRYGDIVLSTTGSKLQTSLLSFDYTVVNNEPTRVMRDTSTLIDLVIASRAGLIRNTRNLELGISDHMLVYACVQTRVRRPPPKIVKGRTFKKFNQCEFIRDLEDAPGLCVLRLMIPMTVTGRDLTSLMTSATDTQLTRK